MGRGKGEQWWGEYPHPIFFLPKNSFLLAADWRGANKKIGVKVGERGVCILRTIPTNLPPLSNLPSS